MKKVLITLVFSIIISMGILAGQKDHKIPIETQREWESTAIRWDFEFGSTVWDSAHSRAIITIKPYKHLIMKSGVVVDYSTITVSVPTYDTGQPNGSTQGFPLIKKEE